MAERRMEPERAELRPGALETGEPLAPPSPYTCPECGGTLWESEPGKLTSLACHTGHGFTTESLLAAQNGTLEEALWTAVRALDEHASLQRRMAEHAPRGGLEGLGARYDVRVRQAEERAALIRQALARGEGLERLDEQPLAR